MIDISKIKPIFTVISTFSGGGGSSLGYKMAGGKVLVANEFIPLAREVYKKNFPNTVIIPNDIRNLSGDDFLKTANIKKGDLDIFDGSPPCSGFSTAGKRNKGWGEDKKYSSSSQVIDDLFFEYTRILNEIQPKVFIAENVKGLAIGKARGYFKLIFNALCDAGYVTTAKIINAKYLGVPQNRERLIFIGIRKDLWIDDFKNKTHPRYDKKPILLREAFSNNMLIERECFLKENTIAFRYWHMNRRGGKYLETHRKHTGKTGWFTYYKLKPGQICNTITTHPDLHHWKEPRTLSISELKKVQSLPNDFYNIGTYLEQYERIGRMVPPIMMEAISKNIYKEILGKI